MSSVDDRVVNMQFNNKQFTQGVTESQKSLTDLEKTLTNTAKSKGLGELGSQVQGATGKFSAMRIAGVTAVATIAAKATAMGLQLVKSLTISPIMDGFREYQTNLTSIQTIIANTGKKLPVVENALNRLNDYSDQTIYNFGQMASAIGKFTAAGVKLGPATNAIRGMANTAALTGASAEDLNRAMYQMSQALSAGTIRLIDWKSLENANMGTSNVRKAIMETAKSMGEQGEVMDEALKKYGNFRESLTEGWLTADVFNKTMKVMGGRLNETTGEIEAFSRAELVAMGYTQQQAKEMHQLSKNALESATVIKTFPQMLSVVRESIGSMWSKIFSGLIGGFEESKELWTGVGNTIIDQVDRIGDGLQGMLTAWRENGGRDAVLEGLKTGFQALGSVLNVVKLAFTDVFPPGAGSALAEMSKNFAAFMTHLTPSAATLESLRKIFGGIFAVLHIGVTIVKALAAGFSAFFGPLFEGTQKGRGGILSFLGSIGEMLMKLDEFLTSGGKMVDIFRKIGAAGGELAGRGIAIASGIVDGIIQGLGDSGGKLRGIVEQIGTNIVDWIKGVLGIASPAAALVPIGANILEGIGKGIVGGIGILFKAIGMIGGAIIDGFQQMFGSMNALDFAAVMNAFLTGGLLYALISMAQAFKNFGNSMRDTLGSIADAIRNFSGVETTADKILKIGIALGILAVSLKILSDIKPAKLATAMGALSVMLGEMLAAMAVMTKMSSGDVSIGSMAASMVAMASAMLILTGAIAALGNMNMETLGKGLGALAIALGIMVGALIAFAKFGGVVKGAAGAMVLMAFAMNILATAIFAFGQMSMETLGKGFGAMAIGLGLMVGALVLVAGVAKTAPAAALAMLTMATSMVVLTAAVAAFGNMDMTTLAKGFGAVAIGLGLFVGALVILGANIGGTVVAAGAMLSMATALAILMPVILALGQADMETLAKGIGAVAIVIGIFVAALTILGVVAAVVGGPLLLLGSALALAGLGMLAFGTGFALMAAAGTAGVAVLTAAFMAFVGLLPQIAIQFAAAFVVFIETIAAMSPRLREAFGAIIENILGTVEDAIPKIGSLFQQFLLTALRVTRNTVPAFIETGFAIIDGFLTSLERHMPSIVDKGASLIIKLLQGLRRNLPKLADEAVKTIISFVNAISGAINNNADKLGEAGLNMAMAIANGLSGGLLSKGVELVKNAAEAIADRLPGWMKKVLGISSPSKVMIPIGAAVGAGMARGITSSIGLVVAAALKLVNALIMSTDESVARLQRTAASRQRDADAAQAKANATKLAAAKVKRTNPKLAKKLTKQAAREQAAATAAQARADAAAEAIQKAQEFAAADNRGKADILTEKAAGYASRAAQMLAKANAEAAKAAELRRRGLRKAAAEMLAQAQRDAAAARTLAALATAEARKATEYLKKEAKERIAELEEEQAFEVADTQGKVDILTQRAAAQEAKAKAAREAAAALLLQAKAIADTDVVRSLALLDQADAQRQAAEDAAKAAADALSQISNLTGAATGAGGVNASLQPSRSILEDAASSVDRYTASLDAAREAAEAAESLVQFNQYNTSPEALSASEIYRQTNNLLSATEIKMGAN